MSSWKRELAFSLGPGTENIIPFRENIDSFSFFVWFGQNKGNFTMFFLFHNVWIIFSNLSVFYIMNRSCNIYTRSWWSLLVISKCFVCCWSWYRRHCHTILKRKDHTTWEACQCKEKRKNICKICLSRKVFCVRIFWESSINKKYYSGKN